MVIPVDSSTLQGTTFFDCLFYSTSPFECIVRMVTDRDRSRRVGSTVRSGIPALRAELPIDRASFYPRNKDGRVRDELRARLRE